MNNLDQMLQELEVQRQAQVAEQVRANKYAVSDPEGDYLYGNGLNALIEIAKKEAKLYPAIKVIRLSDQQVMWPESDDDDEVIRSLFE